MANFEELGIPNNVSSPELNENFLSSLDKILQAQERQQVGRLLNQQEERGLFHSGSTNQRLIEEFLGPSIARRQQAIIPLAMQGAEATRQERLATTEWERRLEELQLQANHQRELLNLQASLGMFQQPRKPSFGEQLTGGLAGALPGFALMGGAGALGGALAGKGAAQGFSDIFTRR